MMSFSPHSTQPAVWARRSLLVVLALILLTSVVLVAPRQVSAATTIPTFEIVSVSPGVSVKIRTANFPANQVFTARIGKYGTLGVGGVAVGQLTSPGGAFEAEFKIPAELKDETRLAIRLDSPQGYFSYNWFDNVASQPSPTATPGTGATPVPVSGYKGIPTFKIDSVVTDTSVTIVTNNFPPNQTFRALMGEYGTMGVGGTEVGTLDSGQGGALTATFNIPAGLKGKARIAIRLQSAQGYFAYNWFYNASTAPAPTATPGGATPVPVSGYKGIPTFAITGVTADETVFIRTTNFPPNQVFTIRMGEYGTLGVGGVVAGTLDSGQGGALVAEIPIPAALKGRARIAIRMDAPAGYFAYNWFYNNTVSPTPGATTAPTTAPTSAPTAAPTQAGTPIPGTGYSGFPTFSVSAVSQDVSVTVQAKNLPPNQNFTVRMGKYGTLAVGGTVAGTFSSGTGGNQTLTFNIPAEVRGLGQIAVRIDSTPGGYFAYNWFYNSTTGQ